MNRRLKVLGLAMLAVFAMGALGAQAASAAVEHEFHSDGEKTVVTGTNSIIIDDGLGGTKTQLSPHEFTIGSAGTWKCNKVTTESTQVGVEVSPETYAADQITVTPHFTECTFAGNPAIVDPEHCSFVYDSDTTTGNTTGGEHANVTIECSEGSSIKIPTNLCTITIGSQEIKHAVRYENDKHNKNAFNIIWTAHGIVVSNLGDKAGCALIPKGAIGKLTGTTTNTCYRDENETTLAGTNKTTPTGTTVEAPETRCTVTNT